MRRLACAACVVFCLGILVPCACAVEKPAPNVIDNGDFQGEVAGTLPEGWVFKAVRPSLAPEFSIATDEERRCLSVRGNGSPDCTGWVSTRAKIELGKTYWFRTRFKRSNSLDPLQHLQFQVVTDQGVQGIAEFHRKEENQVEGEGRICFPGQGSVNAEVRILYRLCPDGAAWIQSVSLTETTPLPPRWVRVACTQGPDTLEEYGLKAFAKMLDAAGEGKADITLLPEYFSGEETIETLSGPSAKLMSEKARKYRMYVAGTIGLRDPATDRLYNSALLFDRNGKQVGRYDKVHLYGPELHSAGVSPGERVPVFQTDFATIGFMTCYDSWFPDVAELVALKGADILLFPNLGYDRELMHARSLDNAINVIASSRSGSYGVWDTLGRDVLGARSDASPNPAFKDVVQLRVANGGLLLATVNLNARPNPEMNGGTLMPVPRSKRHFSNQRNWLEDEIRQEKARWWTDEFDGAEHARPR